MESDLSNLPWWKKFVTTFTQIYSSEHVDLKSGLIQWQRETRYYSRLFRISLNSHIIQRPFLVWIHIFKPSGWRFDSKYPTHKGEVVGVVNSHFACPLVEERKGYISEHRISIKGLQSCYGMNEKGYQRASYLHRVKGLQSCYGM